MNIQPQLLLGQKENLLFVTMPELFEKQLAEFQKRLDEMVERAERRLSEKDPLDRYPEQMTTKECAEAIRRSTKTFSDEAKAKGLKPLSHNRWDKEQFRELIYNPIAKRLEK